MAENILMIALSPTMESGVIARWHKNEGDKITSGDIICEVETDKAVMDYETTQEGYLLKIVAPQGAEVKIGDVIAVIGEKDEKISEIRLEEIKTVPPPEKTEEKPKEVKAFLWEQASDRVKASPLARKVANELGVDLGAINGSGPGGRIVKRDVEEASKHMKHPAAELLSPAMVRGKVQKIPVSGKRKVIARRLSESMFSAVHYYLKISVQMDRILESRKNYIKETSEKVSLNAFLIKFVAEALKAYPTINSSWQGDYVLQFDSKDVGLAVAVPDGLITPVVRDCGSKGVLEIDRELRILIDKAKNNKLRPEEFEWATFTISNLGSFGIEEFTAVINPPGSAILAVGAITNVLASDIEGEGIYVEKRMKMTLGCDHRVIDGATGAAFLKHLKDLMEDPVRIIYSSKLLVVDSY